MKYNDEAWTEPEPAGFEQSELKADPRLLDKAFVAPPAGGFLTVGGTDEDVALLPGRLPPGHAPEVPVAPAPAITVPGGAVDEVAILELVGTYEAGSFVDVIRDASAEPNSPTGAPYPILQDMDGMAVAAGWAGYFNVGIGFTAKAVGNTIEFTPDPGESIALSGLTYFPPADVTLDIHEASGDQSTPAKLVADGTIMPGDKLTVTLTTAIETSVVEFSQPVPVSMLLGARRLADELSKVEGVSAWSDNYDIYLLADGNNTAVNIDSAVVELAAPGSATIDEAGGVVDVPGLVTLAGMFYAGDAVKIDIDVDGTPTSAVVGVLADFAEAHEVAAAFTEPQHLGDVAGVTVTSEAGTVVITPDAGMTVTVTVAQVTPA